MKMTNKIGKYDFTLYSIIVNCSQTKFLSIILVGPQNHHKKII